MVSGLYVFVSFKYLLIIENNNSKHGYQSKTIIKYGDIEALFEAKVIKKIPENKESVYEPESPRYIKPKQLRTSKVINTKTIFNKRTLSNIK